jgi:pyrroloquinoline-quinone synthase
MHEAIKPRHTVNHPMFKQWAAGELSKKCLAGYMHESWHYVTNVFEAFFLIARNAPRDVVELEMENYNEETDPANPHPALFLRFYKACGYNPDDIPKGQPLPSTEAWTQWILKLAREEPWPAAVSALHCSSEYQFSGVMPLILPALREKYKFTEHEIEHFWVHAKADVAHSSSAFDVLERHCMTAAEQDMCVHYAGEAARRRWFYTDCIYLHYEKGELQ